MLGQCHFQLVKNTLLLLVVLPTVEGREISTLRISASRFSACEGESSDPFRFSRCNM